MDNSQLFGRNIQKTNFDCVDIRGGVQLVKSLKYLLKQALECCSIPRLFFQMNKCSLIYSLFSLHIKNQGYRSEKPSLLPARNLRSNGDTTMQTNDCNIRHDLVNFIHEKNKMRVDKGVSKPVLERWECKERGALSSFFG